MEFARKANLFLSVIGMVTFAGMFLYVTLAPQDFDRRTRNFAVEMVKAELDSRFSAVATSDTAEDISAVAGQFSKRLQERIDSWRGSLDAGTDVFIADVLAAACELDCERRDEARGAVRRFYESSIERYGFALDGLEDIVVGEYQEIMSELRADLKVFSGSTAAAFALALFLSVFRGPAAQHLLPISITLTLTTILAITWYAFGQDWVMAVIYSDYWGWGYTLLLLGLSVLMIDIAANRARVTSAILNALPGGANLSPC